MLYSHRSSLTNEITKSLTDLHCLLEIPPSGLPLYFGRGILMKEIQIGKRGKHEEKYFTLVDDSDYEILSKYNWWLHKSKAKKYVRGEIDGKNVLMHRMILGLTDPKILGDHKDRNGLNNQKSNLRTSTRSENNSNRTAKKNGTSKYLGVHLQGKSWIAQMTVNKKRIYLGSFKTEIEAAKAYDEAAKKYHGEFANLNFK